MPTDDSTENVPQTWRGYFAWGVRHPGEAFQFIGMLFFLVPVLASMAIMRFLKWWLE